MRSTIVNTTWGSGSKEQGRVSFHIKLKIIWEGVIQILINIVSEQLWYTIKVKSEGIRVQ